MINYANTPRYWKNKFLCHPVTAYCTTMNSEVTDLSGVAASTREDFSLLSDIVPEDKELRRKLQIDRLDQVRQAGSSQTGRLG